MSVDRNSEQVAYRTVLTSIQGQAGLRLQCKDCGWAHDIWMTTPIPWSEMEAEADRMVVDHRSKYHETVGAGPVVP